MDIKNSLIELSIKKSENRLNALSNGFMVGACEDIISHYLIQCYVNVELFTDEEVNKLNIVYNQLKYGK